MDTPSWVSVNSDGRGGSISKYHRAVKFFAQRNAELKAQGQPPVEVTEEDVKKLYVRFGGLLVGEENSDTEEETPKKRSRKSE